MSIQQIPDNVAKLISSGQVISDISSAIKELIENSLDAEADTIRISIKNYGIDSFEVSDNGSGIKKRDFMYIGKHRATSKITNFEDISNLSTFGFRGEALSSIIRVGNVTLSTRTKEDSLISQLSFDKNGTFTELPSIPGPV